jgi:hypothetical protein
MPIPDATHGPNTENSQNESIPMNERSPEILGPRTAGPDVGERGEYRAAHYPVVGTVAMHDGSTSHVQAIREDR